MSFCHVKHRPSSCKWVWEGRDSRRAWPLPLAAGALLEKNKSLEPLALDDDLMCLPWSAVGTNSHFSSQICHFPKRFDTAKDCTAHGHCYSPGRLETRQKCLTADVIELEPVCPGQVELQGRAGDAKLRKLGGVVRPCLCRIPIHYCYWCI